MERKKSQISIRINDWKDFYRKKETKPFWGNCDPISSLLIICFAQPELDIMAQVDFLCQR